MAIKTHNEKNFLLPDSPRSMASYHAKVMEDGIMKLTIHDCKGSIQLHNNLNNPDEVNEAFQKLEILLKGISELQDFIYLNFKNNIDSRNFRNLENKLKQLTN